jgi:hypothetical protein
MQDLLIIGLVLLAPIIFVTLLNLIHKYFINNMWSCAKHGETYPIYGACGVCRQESYFDSSSGTAYFNKRISNLIDEIIEIKNILKEAGIIVTPPKNISVPDPRGYSVNKIK